MATLYGTVERVKRNLGLASDDVRSDVRLDQLLTDIADLINLRLKDSGVVDPATTVSTDPTIDRIASELTSAKFRMERHQDTREFGFGGSRTTVRGTAWDIAMMELQLWINITQGIGRASESTFEMVKIEGKEKVIHIHDDEYHLGGH